MKTDPHCGLSREEWQLALFTRRMAGDLAEQIPLRPEQVNHLVSCCADQSLPPEQRMRAIQRLLMRANEIITAGACAQRDFDDLSHRPSLREGEQGRMDEDAFCMVQNRFRSRLAACYTGQPARAERAWIALCEDNDAEQAGKILKWNPRLLGTLHGGVHFGFLPDRQRFKALRGLDELIQSGQAYMTARQMRFGETGTQEAERKERLLRRQIKDGATAIRSRKKLDLMQIILASQELKSWESLKQKDPLIAFCKAQERATGEEFANPHLWQAQATALAKRIVASPKWLEQARSSGQEQAIFAASLEEGALREDSPKVTHILPQGLKH